MGDISIWQMLIILILLPLMFLPTIIALKKEHPYKIPIIIINILGGFLWGIGWFIALAWCFILPKKETSNGISTAIEIEKLYELKEKGILSQEEFDFKKKQLL